MGRSLKYEIPGVDPRVALEEWAEKGWSGVFGTAAEGTVRSRVLEIGFGRGEFLLDLATSAPDVEFVGVEVSFKRTLKMARKVAGAALANVRLLEGRAEEAIRAEELAGVPLDLEWSIDRQGTLWWLQARPITTLGPDPQALDTPLRFADDVHTRCNVGEMMPGAVSPLTYSTCARGIDEGWQRIKDDLRMPRARYPAEPYLALSHGHLFINMSEGVRFASGVSGGTADQQSLALCGRIVPEIVEPPAAPLWRRIPRLLRQVTAMLRPGPRVLRMEALARKGAIPAGANALDSWRAIDARMDDLFEAYQLHLVVSSAAGALSPILLQILAGNDEPTDAHHAIVASVLSGATDVESADIAQGAERVLESIVADHESAARFASSSPDEARAWLSARESGEAGARFRAYLERHGHRSLRELDIRQPEWGADPTPILRSLQTQVRSRLEAGDGRTGPPASIASGSWPMRRFAIASGPSPCSSRRRRSSSRPTGRSRSSSSTRGACRTSMRSTSCSTRRSRPSPPPIRDTPFGRRRSAAGRRSPTRRRCASRRSS